jgi:N-acetylglucosamine kinase-like BadF-type ATPase
MILVVDSGSTKADWISGKDGKQTGEFHTMGFNPYFHDSEKVASELAAHPELHALKNDVKEIRFFGAGCSSNERKEIIRVGLQEAFPNANIEVDHDVLASAIATCGDQPGIACIIGTGSNSCYYDGKNVSPNNYGLGYILGDEASGSYFGKLLLTRYLYGILPADLVREFEEVYGKTNKDFVINHVYKMPGANVWLSSFAKFMTERKDHPWVRAEAEKGMNLFFDLFVCGYKDYQKLPVHFIGSVAWFFSDILKEIAANKRISIGKIIRKPIYDLASYYISRPN